VWAAQNKETAMIGTIPAQRVVSSSATFATCFLFVWLGGWSAARAAPIEARESRIVEVTVFADRAEAIREVRVELPAGGSTVEIPDLPHGVEPDSLRVSATGVPALLGAVEIRERAEEPRETAELIAAREEVRGLERQLAALAADAEVDDELREFLGTIRATVATRESTRLTEGGVDPASISGVYEILRDNLRVLSGARLERTERERELREALQVARARLATVRPGSGIRSRVATVEVEAKQAGRLELQLAYVAPGASWRPSYRASLDAATGDVNLVSEGVVRQSTGEDWSGVELRLSTAAPAQGVEPPLLSSQVLRPMEVPVAAAAFPRAKMEHEEGARYQNVLDLAPEPAEEAVSVEATLSRSAYNVAFEVPGRSEVPADGRDHRVVLRNETLAGNIVYRAVPRLAARAYLTSVTTSPADYPLLAGPVRVFAGGAYLGSYRLEEKGPGLELSLPFGVDNRIEVLRLPQPKSSGRSGLTGKQREVELEYRTRLHNLQDRAVKLVYEDRVPVSEDERIEVELDGKRTTPGYRDSERRPGVKLWTIDLAAGEQREIVLAYRVRWPKDLVVAGLE
jgi:uncharacterized protein (TIGR02231 family)